MVSTDAQDQSGLLIKLLSYSHNDWTQILMLANSSTDHLMNADVIRQIDHIIKINQRVALSVGKTYLAYLSQIFNDLINMYKLYSECINNAIKNQQSGAPGVDHMVRPMKGVRRDILKLIQIYIEKEEDFTFFN